MSTILHHFQFAVHFFSIHPKEQKEIVNSIYKMLSEESDILNSYIVPEYEMLHTQSKEYIVNDIVEFMKESGVIE